MAQEDAVDVLRGELAELYFLATEALFEKAVDGGAVVDDGRC
jgi:hypothetical protein